MPQPLPRGEATIEWVFAGLTNADANMVNCSSNVILLGEQIELYSAKVVGTAAATLDLQKATDLTTNTLWIIIGSISYTGQVSCLTESDDGLDHGFYRWHLMP